MFAIGSDPAQPADRRRSGGGLALPIVMVVCAALAAPAAVFPAIAQQVPKTAGTNGVKAFESGAKAFEAGKTDQAIQSLSTALSQGGLSSQQMAKALYYRGAAYRKQGKAAQAISDLTSAVWLKNGLSDSERAAAMDQRQGAYRDAGLGDNPVPIGAAPLDGPAEAQAPAAVASAAPPSTSAAPVAAAWTPPDDSAATAGVARPAAASDSATSSWAVATSAQGAAQASVPNLASPVAVTSGSPDAPMLSALPPDGSAPAAAAPSLGGVGSAIGTAGSAVGNFFSGLFGGSSGATATPQPSAALATSATGSAEQTAGSSAASAANSDWNSSTSIVTAAVQPPSAPAAPSRATPPAATVQGNFKLQVGVVRSRQDAERMADAVRQKHADRLGGASATIDEVVYGNMGTFYRVRIGPYADGGVPGQVCASLKPEGYDCMVVTR